ncbi:MAG: adenylate/guanylate cyclase domain-containing protein [Limisphaerales bacterium]
MINVITVFQGRQSQSELDADDVVIGRSIGDSKPDLALDFDEQIASRHLRVWLRDGATWVDDLGSPGGVLVNGLKIEQPQVVTGADQVVIGETNLTLGTAGQSAPTAAPGDGSNNTEFLIKGEVDAGMASMKGIRKTSERQLDLLFELPLQFAAERDLSKLFKLVLNKVIEITPGAKRGALLVVDRVRGKLGVRASIPEDKPPISRTLIKRAAAEGKGFIWSAEGEVDFSKSMKALSISTGMYCPLMWQDEVMGVICVDTPENKQSFNDDDLRFLIAVAHYAAAAISNSEMQADIEFKNQVQERLMTNFSPKLRSKLVDQARVGALEPGGERSQVTLLMSDIRGFTNTTANMDVQHVVDMLNEYFTELVRAIFENDGTIDKFIGDAILAVFGSPDKDVDQHLKAVKAAIAMQEAVVRVNDRRKARGDVCCDLGIGLHYGEVLHGFIGAEDRLEFTVIGDTVNRTARYCDGARKGMVVISPELHDYVKDKFEFKELMFPTKHEGDFKGHEVIWDDGGIAI